MTTSTEDKIKGAFNEAAGKVKQGIGEAVGNDHLANEGAAQQVKGHAQQAWGSVKAAGEAKVDEIHDRAAVAAETTELRAAEARERQHLANEQHAHDVRESITSTAANVKDRIQHAVSPNPTTDKF